LLLRSPIQAEVAWAAFSGDWQATLTAVDSAIAEAQRRQLNLQETFLQLDRARCLVSLDRVNEAKAQLQDILATARQSGLQPLAQQVEQELQEIAG
jgi:hypothetical protein